MEDQHSTSDDKSEPPRPGTIPDDFRWDPELQGWCAPGEPGVDFMRDVWPEILKRTEEECGDDYEVRPGPPCFTVEELRAAGALDCPPELRKSLRNKRPKRDTPEQLPLFGDDEMSSGDEMSAGDDPSADESA